ncbi:hypothetical protein KUV62_10265 [Salipiger bermudensis]|uniref:hypothetical protein n=1 Tax=Salipiger bermudensis TaxID=344736 RepID=UPI001C99D8D3|nr:hypothetical protein [Salipiger bermudensis]MBY6004294.1 hypothetical protein [Salipiger bermudensis]
MRLFLAVLLAVPCFATAGVETLQVVDQAEDWAMTKASCAEARGLFLVEPAKAADMSEHDVIAMQFIFTYMRGYAAAKGVSYGTILAEFGAFCEANPDIFWLDEH